MSSGFFPNLVIYQEVMMRDPKTYAEVFSELLRDLTVGKKIDRKSILVDLTNTTKTWCDLVYLVCTLMQVDQAFRLRLPHEYFDLPYGLVDINLLRIELEPIIDIENLRSIVRSTYSEYICYLQEIDNFIYWVSNESSMQIGINQLYTDTSRALEHHIRSDYDSCIIKLSTVLEGILDEVLKVLRLNFGTHWNVLTNNQPDPLFNSLGSKAQTLGQVCNRINQLISKQSNKFTNSPEAVLLGRAKAKEISQFTPLIAIGFILQSLGSIRNYSGHGGVHNLLLQTEFESQQMLNSITYIFGKIRLCELFRK